MSVAATIRPPATARQNRRVALPYSYQTTQYGESPCPLNRPSALCLTSPLPSHWFYGGTENPIGPVTSAELFDLARQGTVIRDTPVRKGLDGMWVPANRVRGLFPAPNATSAPTPPVAYPSPMHANEKPPQDQSCPSPTNNFLRSIAFLQEASTASRTEAMGILERFGKLLKAEIDSFSGSHSPLEVEKLVKELASVPGVMRSFFDGNAYGEASRGGTRTGDKTHDLRSLCATPRDYLAD